MNFKMVMWAIFLHTILHLQLLQPRRGVAFQFIISPLTAGMTELVTMVESTRVLLITANIATCFEQVSYKTLSLMATCFEQVSYKMLYLMATCRRCCISWLHALNMFAARCCISWQHALNRLVKSCCVTWQHALLLYLDTWSGFEAAKTAPWPSRGLHHFGKFLEPYLRWVSWPMMLLLPDAVT